MLDEGNLGGDKSLPEVGGATRCTMNDLGASLIVSRRTMLKLTGLSLLPVLMDASRQLVLGLEALDGLTEEQRQAVVNELRAIAARLHALSLEAPECLTEEQRQALASELRAIAARLRALADRLLEADQVAG